MLTVNIMINVMIIGQPAVTVIFRWQARLPYESTFTVMDLRNVTYIGNTPNDFKKPILSFSIDYEVRVF